MTKTSNHQAASSWNGFEVLPDPADSADTSGCELLAVDVPKPSTRDNVCRPRLVTIKRLAALYGVTVCSVYTLIKTDLSFPFKNLGVKKKYMVDLSAFEKWLAERTEKEKCKSLNVPTATDLLKRFKK